jgi:hypothetical protein
MNFHVSRILETSKYPEHAVTGETSGTPLTSRTNPTVLTLGSETSIPLSNASLLTQRRLLMPTLQTFRGSSRIGSPTMSELFAGRTRARPRRLREFFSVINSAP